MASTLAPTIAPDVVLSFEINPGTLLQFLERVPKAGLGSDASKGA